jgi:hypothetical protein
VAAAGARQLEGVAHDAVDTAAREDRLLHGHLVLGARIQAPADLGVLALVVLAHHAQVDVVGTEVAQR